ncbi:hypothetical protein MJO29_005405 [Puccinia striiformis f. sp. tritici]|nr:hypothetical protein MJO29_005405 [Puccinia striiformis f. sp. tritici]
MPPEIYCPRAKMAHSDPYIQSKDLKGPQSIHRLIPVYPAEHLERNNPVAFPDHLVFELLLIHRMRSRSPCASYIKINSTISAAL